MVILSDQDATPQKKIKLSIKSPSADRFQPLLRYLSERDELNEVLKAKLNNLELAHRKKELVDRAQAVAHVFKLARIERAGTLPLAVALSGGADSTALLLACAKATEAMPSAINARVNARAHGMDAVCVFMGTTP